MSDAARTQREFRDGEHDAAAARRYHVLTEHSADVLVELEGGVVTYVSPNSSRYDRLRELAVGQAGASLIHPDDLPLMLKFWAPGWSGDIDATFRMRTRDGWGWREARGFRRTAADGTAGAVLILRDVTERIRLEADLRDSNRELAASREELARKSEALECALIAEREQARLDALTGVLNHGAIADEMRARGAGVDARFAVVVADVDGLKTVNDTYGHAAGDLVLRRVASALLRKDAYVGRYGGDEFLVVLPGADRQSAVAYINEVSAELLEARVIDPVSGASLRALISMGASAFGQDGRDVGALVEKADNLMYAQKRQGRRQGSLANLRRRSDQGVAIAVGLLIPILFGDTSFEQRIRQSAHAMAIHLGYDAVNLDVFDAETQLAAGGAFVRTTETLIEDWDREQRAGPKPIGVLLEQTRAPVIIDDVVTCAYLTEDQRRLLASADINSGIVVPMMAGDRMVAVLSVGRHAREAFLPADAEFLAVVSAQLAPLLALLIPHEEAARQAA